MRTLTFAEAQARHDYKYTVGPADSFDWQDDAPDAWAVAERQLFEERVGEQCDDVAGYMDDAETALQRFIAKHLKSETNPLFTDKIGAEFLKLVSDWRTAIIGRLDRDKIEARCEENMRERADELRGDGYE